MQIFHVTHRVTHRVRLHLPYHDPYAIFVLVEGRAASRTSKTVSLFEEVHLLISFSLKPTFQAVQRCSINVFL